MILRLVVGSWIIAAPLAAQLTFSVVGISGEAPVSAQVQLAATAAGDTVDTLFRVRNIGNAAAPLTLLSIAGSGFSLANLPALPATLPPGAYADFTLRFRPTSAGSFSALLKTDGASVFVLANAVAVMAVYLDDNGYRRALDPQAGLDFGAVERGGRAVRRLILENQNTQPLVALVSVAGSAFQLAAESPATVALDAQNSTTLNLVFAPTQPGLQQGELRIDQRRFTLRGSTFEPPLPKPLVTVDFKDRPPVSAMQPMASVRFDPPPRTSGTGKLRIELKPSVESAQGDPAVLFLSTGTNTIDFAVIEGEPDAQFGPAAAIPFQTGTTAGTIVLTAEVGDDVETATIEIPPHSVVIDAVQMTRTPAGIDVQVTGFDNTRSISQASFTFLQKDGAAVAPGPIQQDLAATFKDYFANSTLGGTFQMKASFPITGNAELIDTLKVSITNSVGQGSWPSGPLN